MITTSSVLLLIDIFVTVINTLLFFLLKLDILAYFTIGYLFLSSIVGILFLIIHRKSIYIDFIENIKYFIPLLFVSITYLYCAICNLNLIISNNQNYLNAHKLLWILFVFFIVICIGQSCFGFEFIRNKKIISTKKIFISIYLLFRSLLFLLFILTIITI